MSEEHANKKRKKKRILPPIPHSQFSTSSTSSTPTIPLLRQSMTPELLVSILRSNSEARSNVVDAMASEDCTCEIAIYYFLTAAQQAEAELRDRPFFATDEEWKLSHRFADTRLLVGVEKFFSDRNLQILTKIQELQDEENRYGSLEPKQQLQMDMLQSSMAKFAKLYDFSARCLTNELQASISDHSTKNFLQTVFFLLLTHCVKVQEIALKKEHNLRLNQHRAFGESLAVPEFLKNLTELTKRYVAFELSESDFVGKVRLLARIGTNITNDINSTIYPT